MPLKEDRLKAAYAVLGLEEGASIELVKSTYRQIALRTHPDKNPNDPNATAQFQNVGEAYNTLMSFLDKSSQSSGEFRNYYDDYDGDYDDYYDDDDEFGYGYDDMDFYRYLFEELMAGRGRGHSRFHFHHQQEPEESPEEYAARLKMAREEQEAAETRRNNEAKHRKAMAEDERAKQRKAAEKRQKAKAEEKRAQSKAQQKQAKEVVQTLQQKRQILRSAIFAAARKGDAAQVKKGIWEDEIDAAGGEVKRGCEQFATLPKDNQETLLHLAAFQGNRDLVEWLDTHNADPEERNNSGFTAFHLAIQQGHASVASYFLETYSPKDEDHKTIYASPPGTDNLLIAVKSFEPEVVWIILDQDISPVDVNASWSWITSVAARAAFERKLGGTLKPSENEKFNDIMELIKKLGRFTPPATPQPSQERDSVRSEGSTANPKALPTQERQQASQRGRGRQTRGRGRGAHRKGPL